MFFKLKHSFQISNFKFQIGAIVLLVSFLITPCPVQAANSGIFTMSLWVNPSGSVASKALIGKAEEFRVFTNASGYPGCQIKTTTWQTAVVSGQQLAVSSWSQVVCTYDLVNLKVYVNGVLKATQALTSLPDDTAASLLIGQDSSSGTTYTNFAGLVDEFKFYNYALTSDEVLTEYNHGSALALGSISDTSGLTGGSVASNSASAQYCIPGDTTSCAPPVAEWNFEEGSGTTVADNSGNGNTGTWYGGGNHWVAGKQGKAGGFNGSNDYVSVTNATNIQWDSASPFTAEAWVIVKDFPVDRGFIFSKEGGSVNMSSWALNIDSSRKFKFDVSKSMVGGDTAICSPTVVLNTWYHVVGVSSGSRVYCYTNAQNGTDTAITYTGTTANTNNLGIGRRIYNSTLPFSGSIDSVRIFNYARTPAQIAWDYNRGGPIARWKMDECQGTVLKDSAGATNSATLTGVTAGTCDDGTGTTAWSAGRLGKFNSSVKFDGTDDVATVTTGLNNIQSVSFWAKPTTVPQNILQLNSSVNLPSNWSGATVYVNGVAGGTVTANTWNHIVAVNATSTSANAIKFGLVGSTYFSGQIDDVQIFNYALTATQVKQLYNQNAGVRFGP